MTYQQTVLNDKPAGFWMITAASGTSETDLSGNAKTATITEATDLIDRAYRPLVTGTSTDRAFRLYSGNHKLTYPALEIWEKGRNHTPFSVEFTVQPITSRRRVDLFAPQEASSANVPDNGIFLENGRLYFSVSNGSASSVSTIKSVASTWLSTGTTYHVIAVYSVSSVSLYVNGVLADSAPVDPGILWSHTVANFITTAYSLSSDTISSSFLFDAVAVYRSELSPKAVNNHYVMSTPNLSETEIVNSLGGKIIQLNDGDRTKAFDYSAKESGWTNNLNTITNLVQNDDGSIGLKKIKHLKMYNASINYNNLLTFNQATAESGTTGMSVTYNPGSLTYTYTAATDQFYTGAQSFKLAFTSGTGISQVNLGSSPYVRVTPGKTYTAHVFARASGALTVQMAGNWYTESNAYISSFNGSGTVITANTWTQKVSGAVVAPANAAWASVEIVVYPANGDTYWFDQVGIWEGTSTIWRAPLVGQTFTPNENVGVRPRNLLVWGGATAEEAYSGMVISNTNQSLARVSTDAYSGSNSWQVTSTGAGASVLSLTHSTFPVEPGKTYTVTCKVKPVTTARNVQQYVNWYDSSNTLLGNSGPVSTATTLNAWNTLRKAVVAPPKAVKGDLYTQTATNMVTGEIFYFDELGLIEGDTTQWVAPTFNNGPYEFSSKEFKYASMENIGEILGADQGAIGTFAMFTAAENDDVAEQVVLSVSSSSQNHILEVVKKADKNLYLRYIYKNTSGVITTSETSWGAISSLLGGLPYLYLEWGGGIVSLYVNSTSSPAQIAFDAGIPSPRFDAKSYMNLGAGYDGARPWNNYFRTTKIYDKVQPSTEFNFNKTLISGVILKFEGNLNVSQVGSAVFGAQTGTDATLANSSITQTRASWSPLSNNVSVSSSPSSIGNLLTYNQATGGELGITGWQGDNATVLVSYAEKYSGQTSIEATSTSITRVGIQTNTPALAVAPGQVYTITIAVKSATTTLTGAAKFSVFDSVGAYLTDVGPTINTTGGGWNIFTGQVTIPANGYSVTFNPYLQTPIVGTKVYFDQMGVWLGTGTTWGEPYQTNVYGSEIVPNQFPGILPGIYYSKASLSTDDSYYAPTKIDLLELEAFANNQETAENGWDETVSATRPRIYSDISPEVKQNLYGGAYIDSIAKGLYVLPVNDTATTAIPDGGSSSSTAGPAALIRTQEFWVYPETQGYHVYYDGATEYSMRYYDSGGFTTTGFTTLYVDGSSVTNGTTSTTWYNRWHHIVLTNASAQININTASTAPVNLLTANQSTGGDTLSSTLGFSNHTGATVTYDTAQQLSGAGAIKSSTVTPNRHSMSTTAYPAPVVPGKTYTARYSVRAGASPTGGFAWSIYIEWHDLNNAAIVSSSQANVTVTQDVWTTLSVTAVAPEGAHYAVVIMYRGAAAGGTTEDAWIDNVAFWEGSSTTWTAAGTKMRIGGIPPGGTQATARYQNISYYPQTFDSTMVTTNYKAYLGDMTGGSASDSGFRNISDAVNLLTTNQASIETDVTGLSAYSNCAIARSTSQSLHGSASLALTSTASGGMTAGTGSGVGIRITVNPNTLYTAALYCRSAVSTRSFQVAVDWINASGTYISNSNAGTVTSTTTGWTKSSGSFTSPGTAAFAIIYINLLATAAGGEVHYIDNLMLTEGPSAEWTLPLLTAPNPKVYNDIWTTETIKIR